MRFVFQPTDVRDWADLSQDFNPIHFDQAVARRMGLDGVVVHGMLPLMHIKRQLGRQLDPHATALWRTIRCKFRQPVAEGRGHQLEVKARPSAFRFSLKRESDGAETIGGSALEAAVDDESASASACFDIAPDVLREKAATFHSAFPEFDRAWLLLDAIVFSQFLSHQIPYELVRQVPGFDDAMDQRDLMHRVLTVQTSHTVSVAPSLWQQPIESFDPARRVECRVLPPVTASGGDKSLAGTCQINVFLDGEFVMQSEVGVFLRFDPFHHSSRGNHEQ
ncbi:MaoC family dehydratase [Nitrogeniibacter aestuarii]|uniref:MaoC family dehydratase n=1 Tax=Nitrogeniibacter aestuarii TaxID=2815343 RepID=UPI001E3ABCB0|nr:MaoC family dehydratase [Nitrogeniibacter aestuarii]